MGTALLVKRFYTGEFLAKNSETKFLVDQNPRKLVHARRVFGSDLSLLHPLEINHRTRWRILLLLTCALPERLRIVAVALIHAKNLQATIPQAREIYLWNPYNLLHYAVDEVLGTEGAYHLVATYPPLRFANYVYSNQVVRELSGESFGAHKVALQPWRIHRDDPILVLYLSKLNFGLQDESERALLNVARSWRDLTRFPIEIYLHYSDRTLNFEGDEREEILLEFGGLLKTEDSLSSASRNQISLSAASSIGLDLLTMDISHFVVAPVRSELPGRSDWQRRLDPEKWNVLTVDASFEVWLRGIRGKYPELFSRVFRQDVLDSK